MKAAKSVSALPLSPSLSLLPQSACEHAQHVLLFVIPEVGFGGTHAACLFSTRVSLSGPP